MADNNFTKGGVLALGKNLTTAIMPLSGLVYEDGVVVSGSASKALSSDQVYDLSRKLPPNSKPQLSTFTTYGKRFKIDESNYAQLKKETGLITPGSVVKKNVVLAAVDHKHKIVAEDRIQG